LTPENVPNRPGCRYNPAFMWQTPFKDEGMIWMILTQLYSTLLELLRLSRLSTDEKE